MIGGGHTLREQLLQRLSLVLAVALRCSKLDPRADAAPDHKRSVEGDFGFSPQSLDAQEAVAEADAALYELQAAVQATVAVADDPRFDNSTIADLLDIALEEITTKGCLCKRTLRRLCAAGSNTRKRPLTAAGGVGCRP